jgi:O-antigen ligase
MFVGGLCTLGAAIIPFNPSKKRATLSTSARFAALFSFLFLIYLTIQAFNPSIEVVRGEGGWWIERITPPLAAWLPASVRADFEPMNAFRVLEWFAASFFVMWGIGIGITRRKTALIILWSLILSGSAMGFVAILQDLADADRVLWTLKSANVNFWGSFFYRNQGAAYLNLILVGSGVLYFYHAKRSLEDAKVGGPHLLLFLLFACVASSVGLALSRGGILFGAILALGFVFLLVLQRVFAAFSTRNSWAVAALSGLLLAGGTYGIATQVDLQAIEERFGDIEATIENAEFDSRAISSKATWEMAQANWVVGWGAGSFRYVFPIYQKNHPEIFYKRYHTKKQEWQGRRAYHYAHNDILQFLAEYGVIGSGLLILTFMSLLAPVVRQIFSSSIFQSAFLLLGIACIAAHAFVEFILNSPAYWVALVGLLAALSKLFTLERTRSQGRHYP